MLSIITKLFGPKPCAICGSWWGACNHGNVTS